jgi:hypothetical protein
VARNSDRPVIPAFRAHEIKDGFWRLIAEFAEKIWYAYLAKNSAYVIHDREFS